MLGDAGPPDLGVPDAGPPIPCQFDQLDPILTLTSTESADAALARVDGAFAAVITHRDEVGSFQTYLYLVPDQGEPPEPVVLTASIPPPVTLRRTLVTSDGAQLWAAIRALRGETGSAFEYETWLARYAPGMEPTLRRLSSSLGFPDALAPNALGGVDLFFSQSSGPNSPPSLVRFRPNLSIAERVEPSTVVDNPGPTIWAPPSFLLQARGPYGDLQLWRGTLGFDGAPNVAGEVFPEKRWADLHLGRPHASPDGQVEFPAWHRDFTTEDEDPKPWRTAIYRCCDAGLEQRWFTMAQAERPQLAKMDACGYILGAGVGALSETNPTTIDGSLWWLEEDEDGRLRVTREWLEVLSSPPGGCHTNLHVAASPKEAAALWVDGCNAGRQTFFRRIRFSQP